MTIDYERFTIRSSTTRLGTGAYPDVEVQMSKTVLADLSALLLGLPADDFGRWRRVSDSIDRYMAGYDYKNERTGSWDN